MASDDRFITDICRQKTGSKHVRETEKAGRVLTSCRLAIAAPGL